MLKGGCNIAASFAKNSCHKDGHYQYLQNAQIFKQIIKAVEMRIFPLKPRGSAR